MCEPPEEDEGEGATPDVVCDVEIGNLKTF